MSFRSVADAKAPPFVYPIATPSEGARFAARSHGSQRRQALCRTPHLAKVDDGTLSSFVRTVAVGAAFAMACVTAIGCSGASNANIDGVTAPSCGRGTVQNGNTCVGAPADASEEAAAATGATDAGVSDAVGDASPTPPSNRCPVGKGPVMAEIPFNGGTYCIDTAEVTNSQFASFLSDTNGHYQPSSGCQPVVTPPSNDPSCSYDPVSKPDYPLRCVTWCAADAYCRWAGKRLCGQIGGGPTTSENLNDPNADQWYRACSSGGKYTFAYGNSEVPGRCDEPRQATPQSALVDGPIPTGANQSCHSPDTAYRYVLDMTGSVYEWVDTCAASQCFYRGGSYYADSLLGWCQESNGGRNMSSPNSYGVTIGFRCCAD